MKDFMENGFDFQHFDKIHTLFSPFVKKTWIKKLIENSFKVTMNLEDYSTDSENASTNDNYRR